MTAEPLLRRAGLSGYDFDDPQVRVPAAGQGDFLEYAAEATGDPAFGLHLAEQANPREIGLLFYIASAAKNLREAVPLFLRYSRLVNESLRLRLVRQPDGVTVEFNFVGVSQQRVRQNTEFWVGMIIKACRGMTGPDVRPVQVACPHFRNVDVPQFRRFYGCPVEFGAPFGRLVFSNDTLALPLFTEDPHLLKLLRPMGEAAARARGRPIGSVRSSVENEVQRLLPLGQVRLETVARALALSARTLSRRLSSEGTTFIEIVDQLRRSLAHEYLKEGWITVAQAAWQLGYESPGPAIRQPPPAARIGYARQPSLLRAARATGSKHPGDPAAGGIVDQAPLAFRAPAWASFLPALGGASAGSFSTGGL